MNDKINAANLFGSIVFSGIGLFGFSYGKKIANFKMLTIGILLMGYPYFVPGTIGLYAVGILLTVALYFFRD